MEVSTIFKEIQLVLIYYYFFLKGGSAEEVEVYFMEAFWSSRAQSCIITLPL